MSTFVNFSLNINYQAEAVRVALAGMYEGYLQDSSDIMVETNQFLNGRERGYCLSVTSVSKSGRNTLLVSFGECRSSDRIFVQHVEVPQGALSLFNGPTLEHFPTESYQGRCGFPEGEVGNVARYIFDLIKEFQG